MKKRGGIILLLLLVCFGDVAFAQWQCSANLIPYRKGDRWGYCDTLKKMIVPPVYNEVKILSSQLLLGYDDTGYSTIYTTGGKQLYVFNYVGDLNKGYISVAVDNKWGLMDSTGRIIVRPELNYQVDEFKEGLAICRSLTGCFVIDTSGKKVIMLDSGSISGFYHGSAWVEQGKNHGSMDRSGKIKWITHNYENFGPASRGFVTVYERSRNGKGLIDYSGKVIIAPEYEKIEPLGASLFMVDDGLEYGVIDTSGKIVAPVQFDKIEVAALNSNYPGGRYYKGHFNSTVYYITTAHNLHGVLDSNGVEIVPPVYSYIGGIDDGVFMVVKDGKQGHIDIHGQLITPIQYEKAGDFKDGISWVMQDKKYRLINKKGEFISAELFDAVNYNNDVDSIIGVTLNGKRGFVNAQGKIAVPIIYDDAGSFYHNSILVRKDSLFGVLDTKGKIIVPVNYSRLDYMSEGYGWAKRNGQYVILDSTGHEKIPPNNCSPQPYSNYFKYGYSYVLINGKGTYVNTDGQVVQSWINYESVGIKDGWFIVGQNKKYGVLNSKEQLIIPLKYDYVNNRRVSSTIYSVKQNGKLGYVNVNGTEYFED